MYHFPAIGEGDEACPPATTRSRGGGGGTRSGGRGRDLRRERGSGGGRGQCRGNGGEDDFVATAKKGTIKGSGRNQG